MRCRPAQSRASAGLPEGRQFRAGQGVPGFDLGRDLAHASQEILLAVIPAPPPAAVKLDEMRAPALGQLTPLPGDLARIPNFDFSGHDRRNEFAMDDDAIRPTFTRNQRNAGRTNHRFAPASACRPPPLAPTAIVEMGLYA